MRGRTKGCKDFLAIEVTLDAKQTGERVSHCHDAHG